jgi:poly(A) polymerase
VPVFPLKGADMIALGHRPGPQVGKVLKTLEKIWCENGFALSKQDLLARLENRA